MIIRARKATDEEENSILFKNIRFHNNVFFTKQQKLRDKFGEESYHSTEKPIGKICRIWDMMLEVGSHLVIPFNLYDHNYFRQIPLDEQVVMRIGARNRTESALIGVYVNSILDRTVGMEVTEIDTDLQYYNIFKEKLEAVSAEVDILNTLPDDLKPLYVNRASKEDVLKALEELESEN